MRLIAKKPHKPGRAMSTSHQCRGRHFRMRAYSPATVSIPLEKCTHNGWSLRYQQRLPPLNKDERSFKGLYNPFLTQLLHLSLVVPHHLTQDLFRMLTQQWRLSDLHWRVRELERTTNRLKGAPL